MSNQAIAQYPIIRSIAKGGAAEVFEVECPTTRRRLALKRLNLSGTAVQRFEREFLPTLAVRCAFTVATLRSLCWLWAACGP